MTDINYKYLWMALLWIGGVLIGMAIQHEIDSGQIESAYMDGWDDATHWCDDRSIPTERICIVNSPNHMGG